MKYIKSLMLVFILMLAFVLVGCGGSKPEPEDPGNDPENPGNDPENPGNDPENPGTNPEDPDDPEQPALTADQISNDVRAAFNLYSQADNLKFRISVNNDGEEASTTITFNYEAGKQAIISLEAIQVNANGTFSTWIDEETSYTNRYDQSKTYVDLSDDDMYEIIDTYNFDAFTEYMNLLLCPGFLKALTNIQQNGDVVSAELDYSAYDIFLDEENELLTTIYDGIMEKISVTATIKYADSKVSEVEVVLTGDTVATLKIEFLGTSNTEIAIDFPDFSEFTK